MANYKTEKNAQYWQIKVYKSCHLAQSPIRHHDHLLPPPPSIFLTFPQSTDRPAPTELGESTTREEKILGVPSLSFSLSLPVSPSLLFLSSLQLACVTFRLT